VCLKRTSGTFEPCRTVDTSSVWLAESVVECFLDCWNARLVLFIHQLGGSFTVVAAPLLTLELVGDPCRLMAEGRPSTNFVPT
jgi:hypothetical protein